MTYEPTDLAKKSPKVLKLDGKLIAIGAEVVRKPPPPYKRQVIPEATKTEYKKLYKKGFKRYIKEVDVKTEEPNTENSTGSSTG